MLTDLNRVATYCLNLGCNYIDIFQWTICHKAGQIHVMEVSFIYPLPVTFHGNLEKNLRHMQGRQTPSAAAPGGRETNTKYQSSRSDAEECEPCAQPIEMRNWISRLSSCSPNQGTSKSSTIFHRRRKQLHLRQKCLAASYPNGAHGLSSQEFVLPAEPTSATANLVRHGKGNSMKLSKPVV